MAGSTLIMIPRFDAKTFLRALGEHRATLMDGVPTAYYYLLAHPDFDAYDLSSLTRCWVGKNKARRFRPYGGAKSPIN